MHWQTTVAVTWTNYRFYSLVYQFTDRQRRHWAVTLSHWCITMMRLQWKDTDNPLHCWSFQRMIFILVYEGPKRDYFCLKYTWKPYRYELFPPIFWWHGFQSAWLSYSYSSAWPFNWTTFLVLVHTCGSRTELSKASLILWRFGLFVKNVRDILPLPSFSVAEYRTCNYSCIYCTSYLNGDFVKWCWYYKIKILLEQNDSLKMVYANATFFSRDM